MLDAVKAILKKFLITTTLKLAGWQAWVVDIIFNVIWKKLVNLGKQEINKVQTEKEQKVILDEHKKVINNPNSSADDIRNSDESFLK